MKVEDINSREGMERFAKAGLSREDNREAVRQLLAGSPRTPSIQSHTHQSGLGRREEGARYDEAFRKTERRLVEAHDRVLRERRLANVQWAGLEGHPQTRRLVMVRNDERLHHWGLFDLLLEKSRELVLTDAETAVGLAELALAVTERLDPEVYGEERVSDFKTAALSTLGDARRLAGDFAGSRLAYSQARINLEIGTGDVLEEASLLGGLVKLLCDLGEYGKAAQMLQRASALYHRMGDSHLDGITVPREKKDKERPEERKGAKAL
jgi:hypothetical protein